MSLMLLNLRAFSTVENPAVVNTDTILSSTLLLLSEDGTFSDS